jgi:hypothetical protein
VIGKHPVELLRHRPVEGAQAGFDVYDRDVELRRGQGSGEGAVGVSIDERGVRLELKHRAFEGFEHAAGHGSMPLASQGKPLPRPRNSKLLEKDVAHVGVVMLAGVDQELLDAPRRIGGEGPAEHSRFHELRSGSDDRKDLHGVSVQLPFKES